VKETLTVNRANNPGLMIRLKLDLSSRHEDNLTGSAVHVFSLIKKKEFNTVIIYQNHFCLTN
jgi:hypothetical protein